MRRIRHHKVTRYPSRNRLMTISRLSQWNRLHKRGKNQLVFVMFTADLDPSAHRLRSALAELTGHNEFQKVLFAVVDVVKASEIADQEDIRNTPTFVVYQSGVISEKLENVEINAAPASIWQMLHRNVVRLRNEKTSQTEEMQRVPRWRKIAGPLIAIAAVATCAFTLFIMNKNDEKDGSGGASKSLFSRWGSRSSRQNRKSSRNQYRPSDDSSDDEF